MTRPRLTVVTGGAPEAPQGPAATCLGYAVEKVGEEPGKVGYLLHGPRATYRLVRYTAEHRHLMYVLNSKGHVANVKGNYRFSDQTGRLIPLS